MDAHVFSIGDNVEFQRSGTWFPATVLSQGPEDMVVIEYKTLIGRNGGDQRCAEAFSAADLRPAPPARSEELRIGEIVEVFRSSCWQRGELVGIRADSRCLVRVDGVEEDLDVDRSDLRACLEWIDGAWRSPARDLKRICKPGIETRTKKLKIKCTTKPPASKFTPGERVEVRSDEAGFEGAWYAATIVRSMNSNNFLIEYETITTDDESAPLRKTFREEDIRPYPPEIGAVEYSRRQAVDVWCNEGWWEGLVSNVIDDSSCAVYFASTDEELVYEKSCLRPHQDWIDGKWVAAAPGAIMDEASGSTPAMHKTSPRKEFEACFSKGTEVEVRHNLEGLVGSWYCAVIDEPNGEDKYIVEYKMLRMEDDSGFLREVVDAQDIRPSPPHVRVESFEPLQKVDAWYNEGWWEGVVLQVLEGSKYGVYFSCTDEEMEFDNEFLRPRQEWIDGSWITAGKDHTFL